jgi:hypothetical protein
MRHGLTAETVVGALEDQEDYKAFELAVASDFDVRTAVERELVLRLASLLWRLRRAVAIETGLLEIQAEALENNATASSEGSSFRRPRRTDPAPAWEIVSEADPTLSALLNRSTANSSNVPIACCFLRLASVDNGAFDRLTRYERALWRQAGQIALMLNLRRP